MRALAAVRRPVAMHRFVVMVDAVMMNVVMPMHCRVMPMLFHVVRIRY